MALLHQNEMGKYFKYAIGEILLVVIGILIALQINNWNENNSRQRKLNNYLLALKDELNGNIDRLNRGTKLWENDLERSIGVIKKLNGDSAKYINSNDLYEAQKWTGPLFKIELYSAVFKDMIYAGVLENLKDAKLKRQIFQIERTIENYDEYFDNAQKIWDDYLLPYYHKHKNVSGLWDSIEHVPMPKLSFQNDIKAFVNNRDYSNLLASRARQVANLKNSSEATKANFEALIKEIELYINHD